MARGPQAGRSPDPRDGRSRRRFITRRSDPHVRAHAAAVGLADVRAVARGRSEPRRGVSLPRARCELPWPRWSLALHAGLRHPAEPRADGTRLLGELAAVALSPARALGRRVADVPTHPRAAPVDLLARWQWPGQDQTIIDWNRQAEITFGWSKNEVLGRTLAEIIIPAEYRQAHQRGIKHFLATKHGPILNRRVELIALRRSGEVFPIELTVIPINVENRYLFYSFVRDISQRKKTEVLVQQSKEELNQARLNAEHLVDERTQELKRELEERKKAWRRKTSGACKGI